MFFPVLFFYHIFTSSEAVASMYDSENVDMNHLWVGERFTQLTEPKDSWLDKKFGFRKSIIPTKNIFQVGLHMSGACKLDYPWNGCEKNSTEFCYANNNNNNNNSKNNYINNSNDNNGNSNNNVTVDNLKTYHSFDQGVTSSDVKDINSTSEGVLYHIMYFRLHFLPSPEIDLSLMNDYAMKHFPNTLEALRKRGLDVLIETPNTVTDVPSVADSWVDYELVYNSRSTLGSLFPGYGDTLRSDKLR